MFERHWFYLRHGRDNGRKRWYYRANPTGPNDWWIILRSEGSECEWFAELWRQGKGPPPD